MWILPVIGYVGIIFGFAFLTLAIASGLYYLSELVEEHTVLAKKLLMRLIYGVVALLVTLAMVDGFSVRLTTLSIVSHVVYAQNLRRFPVVKLTDPVFMLSCALVLINHYLWFIHFSRRADGGRYQQPRYSSYYDTGDPNSLPTFTEIASFFGLCIWFVPFALFVSLSAGENVLPSMGSEYATGPGSSFVSAGRQSSSHADYGVGVGHGGQGLRSGDGFGSATPGAGRRPRANTGNAGLAKVAVDGVRGWVGETGAVMGLWRGENVRPL